MPSTLEQLNPTRVKLTIEIPFADLQPYLDKTYQDVAQQVSIPGFRKGKVPPAVIDQRFGRGVVLQEAINEALPQAYQQAIAENNVKPLGQPEVDVTKLEDNDVVEFTAEVDVRPEFDLPDFSEVKATVDNAQDTSTQVDEDIETLRERFATITDVERKSKKGDQVTIDLKATQDGTELEEGNASGITYVIGGENQMLDGLDKAVTGVKAGETVTFTSTLVGGPHRGEEAQIEVTVTKVSQRELPEVDDEFAQLVSEFDTVDEMREDLGAAVEQRAKQIQIADARDKVLEAALEKVQFDVPEALLKSELDARRQQIERQLAQAHLTLEQYLEDSEEEEATTPEEFWKEIDERSEQALRAQILLDTYADTKELEVSQQELTELIFRKAQENGSTPQDEINHMMEHNHMGDWMQEIRRAKALAQICAAATVVDEAGNTVEMPAPADDGNAEGQSDGKADDAKADEQAEGPKADTQDGDEAEEKKPARKTAAKKSTTKAAADKADEAAASDESEKPQRKPAARKSTGKSTTKADAEGKDDDAAADKPKRKPAARKTAAKKADDEA